MDHIAGCGAYECAATDNNEYLGHLMAVDEGPPTRARACARAETLIAALRPRYAAGGAA